MIKVTVNEEKKEEKPKFPCLMIHHDGTIVLFSKEHVGTAILGFGTALNAEHSESWYMRDFAPFKGSITLEND
jgi:hypothetical protein